MSTARQILVPTDFSEPSRAALEYAASIAKMLGASIDVFHVWEVPSFTPPGTVVLGASAGELSLDELVRRSAHEALEAFVEKARDEGIAVRSGRAERGVPAEAIVDAAKVGNYDLIVIGTHGRTGLSRVMLGSVAEHVVRHAHCPVLSVRVPESHERDLVGRPSSPSAEAV
jgi:nucleotide-binding universal stress UspA family protein